MVRGWGKWCRDEAGMGIRFVLQDGDEFLSPCHSLAETSPGHTKFLFSGQKKI